jgi:hypothetical protein
MSEPNGAAPGGSELLDRIERELNVMRDYHIQFREEYKLLLSALAQTQRGLEELRKNLA